MSFSSKTPQPLPTPPPSAPVQKVQVEKQGDINPITNKENKTVDLKKLQIPLINNSNTTNGLNVPKG